MLWERLTDWNNAILHTLVSTGDRLQLAKKISHKLLCWLVGRHLHSFLQITTFCSHPRTIIQWSARSKSTVCRLAEPSLLEDFCNFASDQTVLEPSRPPAVFVPFVSHHGCLGFFDALWLFCRSTLPNGYGYSFNLCGPFLVWAINKESHSTLQERSTGWTVFLFWDVREYTFAPSCTAL